MNNDLGTPSAFAPVALGAMQHEGKRAEPYSLRAQFLETDGGVFAATGTSIATASISIPTIEPFYLRKIYLFQYRADGSPPLGTYLPPGGFVPDGNGSMFKGLNFTWSMQTNRAGRNWQEGRRDSAMLNPDSSYQLPEDCLLTKDEIITVDAQPLVAADSGDSYRMWLVLDGYKMVK